MAAIVIPLMALMFLFGIVVGMFVGATGIKITRLSGGEKGEGQ